MFYWGIFYFLDIAGKLIIMGAIKTGDVITSGKDGVYIRLCVHPDSSESVFPAGYTTWRNCIEIKVRAEATANKANKEVLQTIASYFNIPMKDTAIISGEKRREKLILVKNLPVTLVRNKIKGDLDGL